MKEEILGTGRRKTAVASVRLRPGKGAVEVNGRPFDQYFPLEIQRAAALAPLAKLERVGKYDILIRVNGGGIEGQVSAIRLGVARALILEDETRHSDMKALGYLTRDPRKREREKYGQPGARKRSQFSKR
jgi:small subunit ribosomal protein S9